MLSAHRIFWIITLCLFITGCSGYQTAAFKGNDVHGALGTDVGTLFVKPGDRVRVTMVDGQAIEGVFLSRDSYRVNLELEGDDSEQECPHPEPGRLVPGLLPLDGIQMIEVYHEANKTPLIVGAGCFVVVAFVVGSSMKNSFTIDWSNADW